MNAGTLLVDCARDPLAMLCCLPVETGCACRMPSAARSRAAAGARRGVVLKLTVRRVVFPPALLGLTFELDTPGAMLLGAGRCCFGQQPAPTPGITLREQAEPPDASPSGG